MRFQRRTNEYTSIAFLDVITCGFGAIILLLMIARIGEPPMDEPVEDPRAAQISNLQRDLFDLRRDTRSAEEALVAKENDLTQAREQLKRLESQLAAAQSEISDEADDGAARAVIAGELKVAQQRLTEEMKRLYAQRDRPRDDLIAGIPVDSEYVIFIIDTSASMFNHAWPKVIEQIVQTLEVYPQVKGMQVMNDMGAYMFPSYAGRWIPDNAARRHVVIDRLRSWNPFSNSSPAEGVAAAIRSYFSPDRKISLFVFGDEFTGRSIREVVQFVSTVNRRDAAGRPRVRIHAVGFPVQFANPPRWQITGIQFAALMRELTRNNGGTFVGLTEFR